MARKFGWRGYVLPRLLTRYPPVTASVVLGAVWGIWHLPIFLLQRSAIYPSPLRAAFPLFVLVVAAESVPMGWTYARTGGSVLSALLFHQGIRIAAVIPTVSGLAAYGIYVTVHGIAAIVVSRVGFRPESSRSESS